MRTRMVSHSAPRCRMSVAWVLGTAEYGEIPSHFERGWWYLHERVFVKADTFFKAIYYHRDDVFTFFIYIQECASDICLVSGELIFCS